jgi:hypothetical protein
LSLVILQKGSLVAPLLGMTPWGWAIYPFFSPALALAFVRMKA